VPNVCFPVQLLEKQTMKNDPFERIGTTAQALIAAHAASFEAAYFTTGDPTPSEGERLALRRAMARFLIDSGMASAHGEV
jgi:hypothetical protein